MRRLLFAYGLLLILLVQGLSDAWLYVWYEVDRQSFTEYLCENIDQPQLECAGSCVIDELNTELDTPLDAMLTAQSYGTSILAMLPPTAPELALPFFDQTMALPAFFLPPAREVDLRSFRPPRG